MTKRAEACKKWKNSQREDAQLGEQNRWIELEYFYCNYDQSYLQQHAELGKRIFQALEKGSPFFK